ncbi:MAG TPA: aminopeptidase P family protein [Armatimonadetes bacterium]|nr:aminopeptidase P family protein [Armatimonadota bacterium]
MKPSPESSRRRLESFAAYLGEQGLDLGLVYDRYNLCYLTGFLRPSAGVGEMKFPLLLVFPDREPVLLVNRGFQDLARETWQGEMIVYNCSDIHYKMVTYPEDAVALLRDYLISQRLSVRRLGAEERYLILAYYRLFADLYPQAEWQDLSGELQRRRACKDENEIALIRRAGELVDLGYRVVKEASVAGTTEIEVYNAANAAVHREVGTFTFFLGDFASGERSVAGGGPATDRVLREGETFICDLWATVHGYWADTCRTFVAGGKPTREQRKMHDVVLRAMGAGEALLRPGTRCAEVYRAIYEVFAAEGWDEHFSHHAGHGIGLHPHEAPFFIPASEEALEPGMTVTLEPGVYLPAYGSGVRCEDNYLITEEGFERLTHFPRGLT